MLKTKKFTLKGRSKLLELNKEIIVRDLQVKKKNNEKYGRRETIPFTLENIPYLLEEGIIEELKEEKPKQISANQLLNEIYFKMKPKYGLSLKQQLSLYNTNKFRFTGILLKEAALSLDNLYPDHIRDFINDNTAFSFQYNLFKDKFEICKISPELIKKFKDPLTLGLFRTEQNAELALEVVDIYINNLKTIK